MVLAAVDLAIIQVRAQLAEKKRQNEEREPPPSVDHPLSTTASPLNLYFIFLSLCITQPDASPVFQGITVPSDHE
ncbi:hypothetical protein K457DRAFT_23064 [Linnemannia elongata AG-77]|uniref:Uncharacterized protein n=1 Tax=Linnemannia elongata AG-77 TaxID=1314771 RepID=A0A197JKE1_9FUNG|nr:hypothetical protein K457DRAFT_23064 [Linnemannia elongata AG-77]